MARSEFECSACQGDGKCADCYGSGTNTHLNEAEPKCRTCRGTGVCQSCEGTGMRSMIGSGILDLGLDKL